ncbi:Cruciform DNA binding protein [Paramarasmius palmivorus]|uniref:Cruciform DNA binding protein n=1 Tax=Paramarasmius palmivorus TaxID=297713 RepID=A0AAW0EB45_9AGAR
MANLHQAVLEWPHGGANNVIVTGSFDQWSSSTRLTKQGSTFKGAVSVPWNSKVVYKFIVDGQWLVNDREPTEWDNAGNLNNVYFSPEKPSEPVVPSAETAAPVPNGTVKEETQAPAKQDSVVGNGKLSTPAAAAIPQLLSDLGKTILAADGTKSSVEYVVSGVGAAIQGVIGVDPINPDKIPVQTPKAEKDIFKPDTPSKQVEDSVLLAEQAPITLAPKVPVEVLPVNSEENKPTSLIVDASTPPVNGSATPGDASDAKENPSVEAVVVSSPETAAAEATEKPVINSSAPIAPASVSESTNADVKTNGHTQPSVETPVISTPEEKQTDDDKSVATSTPTEKATKTEATAASPPAATKVPEVNGNGRAATPVNGSTTSAPSSAAGSRASSPAPSTPKKGKHQKFPSYADESPGSDTSPKSSRFKTISSSRSIRKSLAGLRRVSLKGIFGHKDKEGDEKGK